MSSRPDPSSLEAAAGAEIPASEVELVIEPRDRDLGDGFSVRRLLPAAERRALGPFVFFDHFGPTRFAPGKGIDVRPHPHINLATVTYLFDGEIIHRDSLGSYQPIRSGDINWMTAGRGIVHSERTAPARRAAGATVHGLQLWVALPREHEEVAPEFHHHPAETLPVLAEPGVEMRLLAGQAFGLTSPVRTFSPLVYLDVQMDAGAAVDLPGDLGGRASDLGVYIIEGALTTSSDERTFAPGRMLFLRRGRPARLRAQLPSRFVFLGGEPLPEPRHLWWNFVSSSPERIEAAKRDWRERRGESGGPFPLVPGDETDFIPLPNG